MMYCILCSLLHILHLKTWLSFWFLVQPLQILKLFFICVNMSKLHFKWLTMLHHDAWLPIKMYVLFTSCFSDLSSCPLFSLIHLSSFHHLIPSFLLSPLCSAWGQDGSTNLCVCLCLSAICPLLAATLSTYTYCCVNSSHSYTHQRWQKSQGALTRWFTLMENVTSDKESSGRGGKLTSM